MANFNEIPRQTFLNENEEPKTWYNIRADFNEVDEVEPYLRPDGTPMQPQDLEVIFPKALIEHEFSNERYIPIPKEVQEKYHIFRATPLHRAYDFEKLLGTNCRLYYKYEGVNPSGSHKLNSAIPQVYYNKAAGTKKLTTETGAGQWGTALSIACNMYDIECEVFMVKCSAQQKPQRRLLMETYGASVHESPSPVTEQGRNILKDDPDNIGSLGIAISEAVEIAASNKDTNYALGSVLGHVAMHQTIIGQEAMLQMKKIGETPDMVISCCGGGSNFAGIAFPFAGEKIRGLNNIDIVGVEPAACPTMTKGKYCYDYGDVAHFTPLMLQYTLGNRFMPPAVHAGGLRYHGMSSLVSKLMHMGYARPVSVLQTEVFEAALQFAKAETLLIAPESAHTIAQVIKECKVADAQGKEKVILFNVTGHGNFDMSAYLAYRDGKISNVDYTDDLLVKGFESIPTGAFNDKYLK